MAQDQDAGTGASISEEEARARLARLEQLRTPPTASEIVEIRVLFPWIIRDHQERVQAQLRRGGLQDADVLEVAQEVFIALFKFLVKRGSPDSTAAWIYLKTRCKLRNFLRDRRREPPSTCLPSSGSEPPRTPPDPEGAINRQVVPERVLSQLSCEDQAILQAIEVDELSYEEAALALGIPLGSFKRRLGETRRRLRALAKPYRPGGEAA